MVLDLREQFKLLSPGDVAGTLNVTKHTLAMWRAAGKGPKFVKLGRAVYYRIQDVEAWVNESVVEPALATVVTEERVSA